MLCVTVPTWKVSGTVKITVTSDPDDGRVIATWVRRGGTATYLITQFAPSPVTGDYSFMWPTRKYLDGSGTLRVQHGTTSSRRVNVPVILKNGNTTHFRHTSSDWRTFLPGTWTADTDPVVAAVGDGPSDETTSNAVAQSIATANPALFLFLGDIYERATFTENLNHYGKSALDNPSTASLWGVLARITQPTVGNHDEPNLVAWQDYWHGHPAHMAFTFGGVLFLDLNAMESFAVGSTQYRFAKNALGSAPSCVVAFWHHPVLWDDVVSPDREPMWRLLANRGGDLVVNAHQHSMAVYLPLDANFRLGGGHMVEIVSGAGGHQLGGSDTDSSGRLQWTKGGKPGVMYLTLDGAADGGTATSLSWTFEDPSGNPYVGSSGSVDC
jgi:Calcineurin-like phosphoesterase